jgi:hypothetical protein
VASVEVEVNVTVSPVNGSVGEYVKDAEGTAVAEPANAKEPATAAARAKALTA